MSDLTRRGYRLPRAAFAAGKGKDPPFSINRRVIDPPDVGITEWEGDGTMRGLK